MIETTFWTKLDFWYSVLLLSSNFTISSPSMSDLNIDIGVNYKKINGTETLFLFWNNKNVNAMIASRFSALKLNVLLLKIEFGF